MTKGKREEGGLEAEKEMAKSERNTQREKVVEWEELCCQLENTEKACFDTYHVDTCVRAHTFVFESVTDHY